MNFKEIINVLYDCSENTEENVNLSMIKDEGSRVLSFTHRHVRYEYNNKAITFFENDTKERIKAKLEDAKEVMKGNQFIEKSIVDYMEEYK